MGLFDFWKKEEKSVPAVATISEQTRSGMPKAYIPKFLYKPPFGYPRFVDMPFIRHLAGTPYVEMCITTIIDEICSVPWDIVPKEGKEPTTETEKHIEHAKAFFDNPNTNKESFEEIRRKYLRDILEIDAGVLNKIFNLSSQMVEMVSRDGATFTKNPDIYGMFTDRDDVILDQAILPPNKESSAMAIEPGFISASDARERAAYFQYGWLSGARPVPFGKKEIIWFERNPRTDDIYGRSPVQVLAETIQTLIYSIEHNLEYFNDNSIPKGVLALEGSDADEIDAFKDQWVQQQLKKDSEGNWKKSFHNIPIVGKKPDFVRFQLTNSELELLEGQKWWAKMVWACFGVTSVELGYTEDSKGLANQIVQSNVFRKRSVYPLLRLEEYKINQEIISEFEYDDIEFKFILFDVEEETKRAAFYKLQLDAGIRTINEIRQDEGLDDLEWGDKEPQQNTFNQFGQEPLGKEEGQKKQEGQKEKEKIQGEQKAIETKPFGEYADFQACVRANSDKGNPEAYCAELHKKVTGKWPSEKAWSNNPLILRENEVLDDTRLERTIVYVLRQNEKKIKDLIEKEVGVNKLQEIKAVDDIARAIKNILTFEGLKLISDAVIKNTFTKGWDSAEKQLNKNMMMNKEAISFIQEYTYNNIRSMTDEILTDLRQELERGIMNGEGITAIKNRISGVFDVGENRAEMIARTESNRAENHGKIQAFKTSGEKFTKKWIAAMDDRTSPICRRMNGQEVKENENFTDDPTGFAGPCPPSHVNCRSSVIFLTE
jgi:SPP1 gp7 family putative phage head morphogenesis protein